MCLYQITGEFTGRDTCVTDVRYDSGNRLVAIWVKNCNRRHEKLKVIYVDKERVKRVFRIVQAHDDIIFAAKFSPQSSDSIPLLPHKSCEFMDILKGTDLGIFSVSKAENQAVQTELVCFVERIQQEAVQFFQGRVLYHKGALRNVGLIISVHFHRIEDGFVLHGPKSKHVYTSNRMIIASANHLAYEGTLVKPGFLLWRVTIPVEKLIGSALIEQNSLRQSGKDIVKQETFEVLLTSDVRKKLFVIAREQATMLAA